MRVKKQKLPENAGVKNATLWEIREINMKMTEYLEDHIA